jgi:hypothetical protein
MPLKLAKSFLKYLLIIRISKNNKSEIKNNTIVRDKSSSSFFDTSDFLLDRLNSFGKMIRILN